MIKFAGCVSDEVQRHIKKKEYKRTAIVAAILYILFSGIVITVSLLTDLIGLSFLILTTVFLIMMLLPQKGIVKWLPKEIFIDGETIVFTSAEQQVNREFVHVKHLSDCGNWYEFEFYFPHKNIYFVCQKNLLVEGTIEEFENLFADKIKRRSRKR